MSQKPSELFTFVRGMGTWVHMSYMFWEGMAAWGELKSFPGTVRSELTVCFENQMCSPALGTEQVQLDLV